MPAKPVSISFVAEVAEYLRATKKVEVSTEDIADALVAVSKDAKTLERDLNRAMRDAAKDTERLERVIEELGDETRDTTKKMKKDFGGVSDEMGDVGKEGASEFRQNLAEGLSSGNLEDLVTDTLGGVVSGLSGTVGTVAAVFAGIGAIAFGEMKKRAEEVQEFADTIAENIAGQLDFVNERLTNAARDQAVRDNLEDLGQKFSDMRPDIERLGLDYGEFVSAIAQGSGPALDDIIEKLEYERDLTEKITDGRGVVTEMHRKEQDIARDLLGYVEKERDAVDEVYQTREDINEAYRDFVYATRDARDAWQEIDNFAKNTLDSVKDIPTDIEVKLNMYATGVGAAYINPNSTSYSPGHVAIANWYVKEANG